MGNLARSPLAEYWAGIHSRSVTRAAHLPTGPWSLLSAWSGREGKGSSAVEHARAPCIFIAEVRCFLRGEEPLLNGGIEA